MSVTVASDAGAVERVHGAVPVREIMGPLTRLHTGMTHICNRDLRCKESYV